MKYCWDKNQNEKKRYFLYHLIYVSTLRAAHVLCAFVWGESNKRVYVHYNYLFIYL